MVGRDWTNSTFSKCLNGNRSVYDVGPIYPYYQKSLQLEKINSIYFRLDKVINICLTYKQKKDMNHCVRMVLFVNQFTNNFSPKYYVYSDLGHVIWTIANWTMFLCNPPLDFGRTIYITLILYLLYKYKPLFLQNFKSYNSFPSNERIIVT